jgi:hypothetical protein
MIPSSNLSATLYRRLVPAIAFGVLLVFLSYFVKREESHLLIPSYTLLFLIYVLITYQVKENDVYFWIKTSIVFRCLLFFATPALSDDFYRFIWDGRLLHMNIHPFAEVPSFYRQPGHEASGLTASLFNSLNSKEYFTIYPPVAQFVFWISVVVSPDSVFGSVLAMRFMILVAELVSIMMLGRMSVKHQFSSQHILLYALNPLVIIELTGNLHFEAFIIFFLIVSINFLMSESISLSALFFAGAVCVKLSPLIFLPALISKLGWRKSLWFYCVVALTTVVAFLPLLDENVIAGLSTSIGYYFKKFEFNASIYYLVREWGFWKYGYNIIQTTGWKLGVASFVLILLVSFADSIINLLRIRTVKLHDDSIPSLVKKFQWILVIYILFSTIVHPWYVTPLILFAVFTGYQFALLWSFLIFLTYIGYSVDGYRENLMVTAIEYIAVSACIAYELRKK